MNVYQYQLDNVKNKLSSLLLYSKTCIPFYKRINKPVDYYLESYDAWCEIPLTHKKNIQHDWRNFVSSEDIINSPNVMISHTSGSSGDPLKIIKERTYEIRLAKKLWKIRQNWHKDIMKLRLLYLYRNVESNKQNVLRLGENDDYLDLSENGLIGYIDEILAYKPQWIIGPPIAVNKLANFCKSQNINIDGVKLAELFGEMLLPYQRKNIEEAFG